MLINAMTSIATNWKIIVYKREKDCWLEGNLPLFYKAILL